MNLPILFVDDEQFVLDGIRRLLDPDLRAEFVLGPEAGLHRVRNGETLAIVVADLKMPGMDGIKFLRAVNDISPTTILVLLTGNGSLQVAEQAVDHAGVFHYLKKPCSAEELSQAIKSCLKLHSLNKRIDQINKKAS